MQAASRRLARTLFHAMLRYQQGLEKRQLVLFRLVEVGVDLFAMAATISRAAMLKEDAVALADLFCLEARRRIDQRLAQPDLPTDRAGYRVAQDVLAGRCAWLESEIVA